MKKIILSLTLLGFVAAVQAGDTKAAQNDKPACCAKTKVAVSTKAECPMAAKQAKAGCAAGGCSKEVAKVALQSPKGSEQAKK
jgi:hypothetical protein